MLLFENDDLVKRKAVRIKALPPIPATGWRAPEGPPNLSGAAYIGVDTETYDPELLSAGPGWGRGKGKGEIIGVSLAARDWHGNRGKWYFPIRHKVCPEQNLKPNHVLPWLKDVLADPFTVKVFANAPYDMGWLFEEGITVGGRIEDVQYAEALIDNNARVSLETLARKYLNRGKNDSLAEAWVREAYGKAGDWRAHLHQTPPSLAGPYAEDDADLPLDLLPLQGPLLDFEGLTDVYRMEVELIPLMQAMRRAGVHVDVEAAHLMKTDLDTEISAMYESVWKDFGYDLVDKDGERSTHGNVIGPFLESLGIAVPRTKPSKTYPDGNFSVTKEWMEEIAAAHPVGKLLNDIREHEKMSGTFIQSYILDKNVNGMLYPQFHQMRNEDDGGTKVYRYSSSHPNLQNIPSRTKLGKRVRRLFLPDPGHKWWRKHDYSQIHYRILAHYAVDKGDGSADKLRQAYIDDPDMDYHFNVYQNVAPMIHWSTDYLHDDAGKLLPMDQQNDEIVDHRRIIKNVNFSGLYGVGEKTLARRYLIGMDSAGVKAFLTGYHEGAPYIKATMEQIAGETEQLGYVTTLLGRKIRFELWEPIAYQENHVPALPYEQALKFYGSFIRLAGLYRAVNYRFQGSEPDIMKTGMLKLWKSGVFDFTGVPRVTVHDELGWSQIDDSPQMEEAFAYIKHEQENAIPLRVPVKVDAHKAGNWGDAK